MICLFLMTKKSVKKWGYVNKRSGAKNRRMHCITKLVLGSLLKEVIDQGGEPITAGEYTGIGRVTEFKYCFGLGSNVNNLRNLQTIGSSWGYLAPMSRKLKNFILFRL